MKIAFEMKKPRDPLDVLRIWRPSWTMPGTSPKLPSTRTRSATERAIWVPLPWGDREAGLLQGRDIIYPVTDHAHVLVVFGQHPDHPLLALRVRCGRSRASRRSPPGALRRFRAAPRRSGRGRWCRGRYPCPERRADRGRGVTGRIFRATSSRWKKSTVSVAFGRRFSARTIRPSRGEVGRELRVGVGVRQRPGARRSPVPGDLRRPARWRWTEGPGAVPGEQGFGARRARRSPPISRAPQRRPEERGPGRSGPRTGAGWTPDPPTSCRQLRCRARPGGFQGAVAGTASRRRNGRTSGRGLLRIRRRQGISSTTLRRRFGQGAGLVGAEDADRGQRLDRVELLGEDAAAGHLRGRKPRRSARPAGSGPPGRCSPPRR